MAKKETFLSREDELYLQSIPPDPGFDPEKNRRVMEGVLKRTEAMHRNKRREFNVATQERGEAISHYLDHLKKRGSPGVEKFFGRRYLAYLKGREFRDELREKLTVIGKDGKKRERVES